VALETVSKQPRFPQVPELKQAIDDGQDVSSKDVFEFAEKGDHFALMVVDRVTRNSF
jgi:predicted NBD/HSP70 family sugar kinase